VLEPTDRATSADAAAPALAAADPTPPASRAAAYAVHLFTASGVVMAFLATAEVCSPSPDPRRVFLWLAIQVLIDAADGPLARRFQVKRVVPEVDGRTIDDLVDYLTYTFVPLLLVWRMGWVPQPAAAWVAPAMVASLFGFANTGAKDEQRGFFLGFPSYWNIVALYAGLWHPWVSGLVIVGLAILTVLPVRFVYPNLAPRPWKWPVLIGALLWTILLAAMVVTYPRVATWLMVVSLIYPALYAALSVHLDLRARRADRAPAG
jgi:phosphatidylcholine synthase